jgi:hypothetical protein
MSKCHFPPRDLHSLLDFETQNSMIVIVDDKDFEKANFCFCNIALSSCPYGPMNITISCNCRKISISFLIILFPDVAQKTIKSCVLGTCRTPRQTRATRTPTHLFTYPRKTPEYYHATVQSCPSEKNKRQIGCQRAFETGGYWPLFKLTKVSSLLESVTPSPVLGLEVLGQCYECKPT